MGATWGPGIQHTYSAVVLYYRLGASIVDTVDSLRRQDPPPRTVVLVDNDSRDGVIDALVADGRLPEVSVLSLDENLGYSGGMNAGIEAASPEESEFLLLMTHEVRLQPGCAEEMLRVAKAERASAVGPTLQLPDGRIWSRGGRLDRLGRTHHLREERLPGAADVDWIDGACMLVRTRAFLDCGGLDDRYFLYWEDVDLSLRLRSRGRVVVAAEARAVQAPSARQPAYYMARNRLMLWRTHKQWSRLAMSVVDVLASLAKRVVLIGRPEARADIPMLARALRDGLTPSRTRVRASQSATV